MEETVRRNDYFRFGLKPFVVSIAGIPEPERTPWRQHSKDCLGKRSTTLLSGDNYHAWDRKKPMWKTMTHLNPAANDLEGFASHLMNLIDGRDVFAKHYDHTEGKMSRPSKMKANDIIIASGLHALHLPILRECSDLGIYLDMDENLRRHFKIDRDTHDRNHTKEQIISSIEKRLPDSAKFIHPQIDHADLIFSIRPMRPLSDGKIDDSALGLVVKSRLGFSESNLVRILVGTCGLRVDMEERAGLSEVCLTMGGLMEPEDVALAAKRMCPKMLDFLDANPRWEGSVTGLMQLTTLSHINQVLAKRMLR